MHSRIDRITRRAFCGTTLAALGHVALAKPTSTSSDAYGFVARTDRARVLKAARQYLPDEPRTIPSFPSSRSPGGLHDYFSEADYWWPNPADPNGPYVN